MNSKSNFKSRSLILLAGALLSASALVACGDDSGSSAQPVEHQSAHQALGANIQVAADDLNLGLGYLRSDAKFGIGAAVSALDQEADEECFGDFDSQTGEWQESCDITHAASAEEQIQDAADLVIDELNARIFTESNIEEETDTKITYLVDGQSFCAGNEDQEECAENIDALQLRLVVTSPAAGDINIGVLVGEARYNPLDVELHRAKLAAELDLGELRPTIDLIADIGGEPLGELPTLMQGRVRAELAHTATRAAVTFAIQEKIVVSGNDWSIKADPAAPAARFTIDSAAESISALLALKPVEVQAPITTTEYHWDSETGETETTSEFDILAHLAGASFNLDYHIGDDHIEIPNIGLGNAQSTLDIDGHRVLEVDLNANSGRALSVSIQALGDEGAEITLSPGFDLALMLKFAAVQQHFEDLSEWLLDDTLRIAFNGAAAPKLRVEEGRFEVIDGTLAISSTAASIDVEIQAGQCLLSDIDDLPVDHVDGVDGDFDGDFGDTSEEAHPFEGIYGGSCE